MDFVGLALDIIGLAQSLADAVEEVKEFKHRSQRLLDRIQCLQPALDVLSDMKSDRDRIMALQKQDPSLRLPVFSKALTELKQVIAKATAFIVCLKKTDRAKKFLKRKSFGGQFDSFSERLDVLQNTLQFGILVEMRGLMERLLGEEQKMANSMSDLKSRMESSKKGFKNRQDVDLDDDEKDTEELLAAMNSIQQGQDKAAEGIERIDKRLEKMQIALSKGTDKASRAGFSIDDLKFIKANELTFKGKIGAGSMGVVYKAVYNRHKVAVKKLQPDRRANLGEIKKAMKREAENLKKFDSKNVVRLWGLCQEKGPNDTITLMIVMEFMDRGTLKDALQKLRRKEGTRINWLRRAHMALGGSLGLYRIHSMQPPMLHCAIDSTKFLVDKNFEVKISDVGFAHTRSSSGREHVKRAISYYAPENLWNPNQTYDERSEMYSFGVVMWEIATCREPYAEFQSDEEKMKFLVEKKEVEKVPDIDGLPKGFKKIINKCRSQDRMLRPLSAEVVDKLQGIEEKLEDSDSDSSDIDD